MFYIVNINISPVLFLIAVQLRRLPMRNTLALYC